MNDGKLSMLPAKRIALGAIFFILFLLVLWVVSAYISPSLSHADRNASFTTPQPGMLSVSGFAVGAPAYQDVAMDGAVDANSYAREASMKMIVPSAPPYPDSSATAPASVSKMVKSGNLSLLVENVDSAADNIQALRAQLGGQQGNSSFSEYANGAKIGNITIWVPSERFDEAMSSIKKAALRVENESISATDVSAQFVDLSARLKNMHATEVQLLEVMKRAGTINEILNVTRELSNTRSQIEQLQGELDQLAHRTELSAITISLHEEAVPIDAAHEWRPLTVIKAAVKDTLSDLTATVDIILILLIKLPVLLLNIGFWILIFWLLWRAGRYAYHRMRPMASTPLK